MPRKQKRAYRATERNTLYAKVVKLHLDNLTGIQSAGLWFALRLAKEQWAKMTPKEKCAFEIAYGAMNTGDMIRTLETFWRGYEERKQKEKS